MAEKLNLKIWVTYHDDKQIDEYCLKEDEIIKLFKGNDVRIKGSNINFLNKFYCEIVTLYYVWKNNMRSDFVGFGHYRRMFNQISNLEEKQCQVLSIVRGLQIFNHYKSAHNYQDMYDIIEILNEQYGKDNKYSNYLLESNVFVPFCCFIMHYSDFDRLCSWLFPIIFEYDKKNNLNMNAARYQEKAEKDFRFDNIDYQCRAVGFLAERLISCYIVTEMKPFCINTL